MTRSWSWLTSLTSARAKRDADTPLAKASFSEQAIPEMGAVYRFALRLCGGNTSEAEDVVQETFLRAYRAWDRYEPGTTCRPWLFTICRREFLRMRERERKHFDARMCGRKNAK